MPTTSIVVPKVPERYLTRLRALLADGQRKLIGLTGAPGAGKSTLAHAIREAFPADSQVVPMDGFHLANVELERLGRSNRKGAPDTFDSAGYVALLRRLRDQAANAIVYAPDFRRALEEPIAGAIPIFPETRLLITEGIYLLLDQGEWRNISGCLDEIWYIDIDHRLRVERLTQRHQDFGRSHEAAIAWVTNTDEPNARLIEQGKSRADLIFSWHAD